MSLASPALAGGFFTTALPNKLAFKRLKSTLNSDKFLTGLRAYSLAQMLTKSKTKCPVDKYIIISKYLHNLYGRKEVEGSEVAQSCPTLCDPTDCSPPGSSVRGILQARVPEWVAIPFSRVSSQPRDRTLVSCRQILYPLSYREVLTVVLLFFFHGHLKINSCIEM